MVNLSKQYERATHAERDGQYIKFSYKKFDSDKFKGNQRKGFVFFKKNDGTLTKQFVKLDEISRATKGQFKSNFDYQYASVSEDMSSIFLRSLVNNDSDFTSVDNYQFEMFEIENRLVSGVLVDDYVQPGHLEKILTHKIQDEPYNQYLVNYNEFIKNVATCTVSKIVLKNLIQFFVRYGVNFDQAKHFLVQQAGFDMLLGNIDRKENSGNFVFIANDQQVIPINFDYGRMLQIIWTDKTEMKFSNGKFSSEDIKEITLDYVESIIGMRGGIINSTNREENIQFLLDNGFQPFKIDLEILQEKLSLHVDKIEHLKPEIKHFVRMKARVLLQLLRDKRVSQLVEVV